MFVEIDTLYKKRLSGEKTKHCHLQHKDCFVDLECLHSAATEITFSVWQQSSEEDVDFLRGLKIFVHHVPP